MPLLNKVKTIMVKDLQGFVGMVNFYTQFILGTAWMMSPFFTTLSGKPKTLKILVWMNDMF